MKFLIHYVCIIFLPIVWSSSILLMCPFPAPSHWLWIEHFARGLIDRGHQLTVVTNHPTKQPHPNYTEIIIEPKFNIPSYFPKEDIFQMKFNSDFQNLYLFWDVGVLTTEYALNDPKVKDLIKRKDLRFDLMILEQFFHESFLMFAHKFKVPIVTLGTFGYADNMDRAMGLMTPWSFVPHIVLPYNDNMNFFQRAYNTIISIYDAVLRRVYYIPKQQAMAEKHFKDIEGPLPSVLDLERNISMMLINSHRSMNAPRPSISGLLNVGGVHIKPVKPLPHDIKAFLDGATNGAIYFSLGSYVNSNEMPKEKVRIILETFKRLKQRVLWKYEDSSIGKLPDNVMISKWMPQSDILAHKNVVLFITHGGLFGTQEGVYRGVPMLFMPLYGDQHRNSKKSVEAGYALSIDLGTLTIDGLYEKIKILLDDKKYTEKIKEMSELFRDNPISPLDESMYWIEYVIRHKGAKHLKSASIHLKWYEYFLLDVFLLFACIGFGGIFIIYKIISIVTSLPFIKKKLE